MKNITLRQLRAFAAVAQRANFARAAHDLHLTPPAVTMQIKELEREVGLPLFDREAKQIQLTLTGEYLLTYARRVLAELKNAHDMVAQLKRLEGGEVVVGMVSSAQHFLPALLAEFRADHRDVMLRLRVGNRDQLAAWMRDNELDLAVMGRPPREMATRAEPFAVNPLVLVTARDHPFTRMEQVAAQRISLETLLLRESGSGTRAALEEYLREHHLHLGVTMELPSNETIKQAVIAGLGVSLVSQHSLGLELQHGLLAVPEVEGLPMLRRWYLVKNHAKTLSPAAEAFRYFVLEHAQSRLQPPLSRAAHDARPPRSGAHSTAGSPGDAP
jgi:LysR family transcriptional regulator, low CO2-responsive transcriptional regulator